MERNISDDDLRCLTVLETRFNALLPHLATKADLANLEANLAAKTYQRSAGKFEWVMGLCIGGIAGLGLGMAILSFTVL